MLIRINNSCAVIYPVLLPTSLLFPGGHSRPWVVLDLQNVETVTGVDMTRLSLIPEVLHVLFWHLRTCRGEPLVSAPENDSLSLSMSGLSDPFGDCLKAGTP